MAGASIREDVTGKQTTVGNFKPTLLSSAFSVLLRLLFLQKTAETVANLDIELWIFHFINKLQIPLKVQIKLFWLPGHLVK